MTATPRRPRILCVDDEQHVLDGLSRILRRSYEVEVARGGALAIYRLERRPYFEVVISDMRMPQVNGTKVLQAAREHMPDATRMLLTGQADVHDAAGAVNEGQIFRYLTKPCSPTELDRALQQAVEQHDLRVAQRQLIEETLTGSVRSIVELLAMANPMAFGRANRARELVVAVTRLIGFRDVWHMEMAALLSQIGVLTLPPELAQRLGEGGELTAAEEQLVDRLPHEALRVLGTIPRLDEVRETLSCLMLDFDGAPEDGPRGEQIPLGARLLRPILDLDRLMSRSIAPLEAVRRLEQRGGRYDPAVLTDLASLFQRGVANEPYVEMKLTEVREGMIFVADVRQPDGTLLIARRQKVTESLLDRIHSYWANLDTVNPVRVAPQPA
jgi:response regulator RpfG family c-di-GMP phosphodiesterase